MRYFHTAFHSGCTICIPTNSAKGFPFSTFLQASVVFYLFMIAIGADVRWYLIVVFIWISLIISDVEHLFTCLLAICMSSLEKSLLRSFAIFNWDVSFFLVLSFVSTYKFWILTLHQMYQQICSPILWVVFLFCWLFPLLYENF